MAIARGRKAESKTTGKSAKPAARRAEAAAPATEGESLGYFGGMAVVTGVLLLLAFVMIDKYRGGYGEGIFFK
jgi:hypothetical protein